MLLLTLKKQDFVPKKNFVVGKLCKYCLDPEPEPEPEPEQQQIIISVDL
jgi:hypothetical protein